MKPCPLLVRVLVSVLLAGIFACKPDRDPPPAVCRLLSTTDQLVESSGRLTDEMQRTFTYTNAVLTSVAERAASQEAGFLIEYSSGQAVRATGATMAIGLAYEPATTQPVGATFSRGGRVNATFVMAYDPAGRMTRIVETRLVLPLNSLTTERAFTFMYDNAGNLTTERVRFMLSNGVVVVQETEYTPGTNPSPYTRFPERALLTVVALSQAVETMPGQFWHRNTPVSHKSYFLTNSGNRGELRESSTFATTSDANGNPASQAQNALLYQLSTPDPITKKNRQTFTYQCD